MEHKVRITAKKSLGQNFLVNPGVLGRIVEAAGVGPSDTVLEIGPGTGALTERLAATGAKITAMEKDRRLIAPLREKFANDPNVEIVEDDALRFDPSAFGLQATSYKLVANLPYYLTSRLIRIILEKWRPARAVLMVQREVADRMMARPPDMNLLALSVRLYAKPSLVMRVSRGSFRPIPNVDSAVVKLELRDTNSELREESEQVLALAKKAFGQKRKQLKATIPENALQQASIRPTARPEELSVDDWHRLALATR